jgi:hypothetical protein
MYEQYRMNITGMNSTIWTVHVHGQHPYEQYWYETAPYKQYVCMNSHVHEQSGMNSASDMNIDPSWTVSLGAVAVRFRSYIRNNTKKIINKFWLHS